MQTDGPCAGIPGGRSCEYRVSTPQNTATRARRNNGRDAGRSTHYRRGRRKPQRTRGHGPSSACRRPRGCAAARRPAGSAGGARHGGAAEHRRSHHAHAVRAGAQRRLAVVAGRAASRSRQRSRQLGVRHAHAHHVRRFRARAAVRADGAPPYADRRDRACARAVGPGAAADLPGRVWLSGVCAHGRAARAGPLYALSRRSWDRSRVRLRGMAVPELSLRSPVHAVHLRTGAAGRGGGAVDVESGGRACEPRRDRADRESGGAPWTRRALGGRVRGIEPRRAGDGCGRRPQRHAGDAADGGGAARYRRQFASHS